MKIAPSYTPEPYHSSRPANKSLARQVQPPPPPRANPSRHISGLPAPDQSWRAEGEQRQAGSIPPSQASCHDNSPGKHAAGMRHASAALTSQPYDPGPQQTYNRMVPKESATQNCVMPVSMLCLLNKTAGANAGTLLPRPPTTIAERTPTIHPAKKSAGATPSQPPTAPRIHSSTPKVSTVKVQAQLAGHEVEAIIDSGSGTCAVSFDFLCRAGLDHYIRPNIRSTYSNADGRTTKGKGKALNLPLTIGGATVNITPVVTEALPAITPGAAPLTIGYAGSCHWRKCWHKPCRQKTEVMIRAT
jgi:hypothetical protein